MHNSPLVGRRRGDDRALRLRLPSALLALTLVFGAQFGVAGTETGSAPSIPDLTGDWKLDSGGTIHIDFFNSTGSPSIANYFVDGGDCKYGGHRGKLFDSASFTDANTMTGEMEVCTHSKELIDQCHVDPTFTVQYTTTSSSKDAIIGTLMSEWYAPTKGDECKLTRDPSGDSKKPFTLKRASKNPCPDTDAIKQYSQVSNRAVGNIATIESGLQRLNAAGSKVVQNGLASAQSQLNTISRGLGEIAEAGEECDKLHSVLDDIKQFQSAIDQINNAGCNTMALAGGFDNLFAAAGKLGNAFNPFPALAPAFNILSQDQNFFTAVSGNLDPETRWADQFQNVEGYIPNCSQ